MRVLVDTSALYAVASDDDRWHDRASLIYHRVLVGQHTMVTPSYVVSEVAALVQKRLGLRSLAAFRRALAAARVRIIWVDEALHEAAWDELGRMDRRDVSLVDCSLAVAGREAGIEHVFAFDPHMELLGLTPVTPELLS